VICSGSSPYLLVQQKQIKQLVKQFLLYHKLSVRNQNHDAEILISRNSLSANVVHDRMNDLAENIL